MSEKDNRESGSPSVTNHISAPNIKHSPALEKRRAVCHNILWGDNHYFETYFENNFGVQYVDSAMVYEIQWYSYFPKWIQSRYCCTKPVDIKAAFKNEKLIDEFETVQNKTKFCFKPTDRDCFNYVLTHGSFELTPKQHKTLLQTIYSTYLPHTRQNFYDRIFAGNKGIPWLECLPCQ